ncbi:MAG TPA: glycoside hydrolase family 15 protein [Chloroflexota bacterium]
MRLSRSAAVLALALLVIPIGPLAHGAGAKPVVAPKPRGAPTSTWTSGNKDGVGTAYTYAPSGWPKTSRVFFTLFNGGLSEVFYPTYDTTAVNTLRFFVDDGHFLADEEHDLKVTIRLADPHALAYTITSTDARHGYQLIKTVITDPGREAVVMQVRFVALKAAARHDHLYLNVEPTLGGDSLGNSITAASGHLVAWKGKDALALVTSARVTGSAVGYRPVNDPITQLRQHGRIQHPYTQAKSGTVAGLLELAPQKAAFTAVLGFGGGQAAALRTANAALHVSFSGLERAYVQGWNTYCNGLDTLGGHATAEYYLSAMTIKAAEDKTYEGAIVASPTHPFGQTTAEFNISTGSSNRGYALVWPRDLYHASLALLAAGDRQTASEALRFLARTQLPNGAEPQNVHVQGGAYFGGIQMDEAADVMLLAWRLGAASLYSGVVVPAANYLVSLGPATPQERWEENAGFSPATIAAEIAALTAAADMAKTTGDSAAATRFQNTADSWERAVESETYTTTGPLGAHQYYLRISDGHPNAATPLTLANGGGQYDQRSIVDPSFLELVRLGVRSPTDPRILATISVVDAALKGVTPKGAVWHRYNHDGYGDPAQPLGPGVGHLWPVLSGERGMYDVAAGDLPGATQMLHAMEQFAGPTGLIPEQVLESNGAPTSSANPLNWAQGEYIILLRSILERHPFDQPSIVALRYSPG